MRIAFRPCMILIAAAAVVVASTGFVVRAQDDPPSLVDLEADYMVLMSEADALGRGRTIQESLRFSTNRQSILRVQLAETEALLRRQGMNVRDLAEARARFADDESADAFEDLAGEGAEEIAERIAGTGLSAGMKRTLGGIGFLLDAAENGAEWVVQYMNTSDLLEGLQNGAIQTRQVADLYSVMNAELSAEIRAEARLREILPEQRRLFAAIAEERQRQNLSAGPATRYAAPGEREDDAAGDEDLATASLAEGASRPGPVAGTYDSSFGRMRLNSSGGAYTNPEGRIVVTSIAGSAMEGVWVQSTSGRECPAGRYGRYFGRVRFTFNAEGFTGVWGYCDEPLERSWNGVRVR